MAMASKGHVYKSGGWAGVCLAYAAWKSMSPFSRHCFHRCHLGLWLADDCFDCVIIGARSHNLQFSIARTSHTHTRTLNWNNNYV